MKRSNWFAGLLAGLGSVLMTAAMAQPPGPPEGGPPPEHRDPLRAALDANRDFELDADEIANAPAAIKTLDRDGDGRLGRDEMRPPMGPPPGGPGRGPEGRGFDGPPRRPGEGGRPPRDGDQGRPPRDGGEGAPPQRDAARREAGGPPGDRPSPERFVNRAMSFDADGDGKLDESELRKMAEAMRAGRGSGGPPREGGERPERPRNPD